MLRCPPFFQPSRRTSVTVGHPLYPSEICRQCTGSIALILSAREPPYLPAYEGHEPVTSRCTPSRHPDILGHADLKSTEIYAKADLEMKRQALANASNQSPTLQVPSWQQNKTLMGWLQSL